MRRRAVLLLALFACHKAAPGDDHKAEPANVAHPVDHLAPDELLEGSQKAFALVLPRVVEVQGAFVDVVYATAAAPAAVLGKYLREHVRDGKVSERDGGTVFEKVRVASEPERWLTIRVRPQGLLRTSLEVRDVTPPPPLAAPDGASRWRAAGLTPNGQVLDPTHAH